MLAVLLLLSGCSMRHGTHVTTTTEMNTPSEATTGHQSPTSNSTITVPIGSPIPSPTPTVLNRPRVFQGATTAVTSLAWSPDGSLLAAAGAAPPDEGDHAIRLWRADGTLAATLKGHTDLVTSLAWSPDGKTLASGSLDKTVRLWTATGTLENTLSGVNGPLAKVFSVAWSPDGNTLAVGTIGYPKFLDGSVQLFQANGQFIRTMPSTLSTGGKFLNLAWSPDGSMLAAGAVGYDIWRVDGSLVGTIQPSAPQWGFAWSPDGKYVAVGDENGFVEVLTPEGEGLANWQQNGSPGFLAFSPDGSVLAVTSRSYLVRLLPLGLSEGQPIDIVQSSTQPVSPVWSVASDTVAVSANDGTIHTVDERGVARTVMTGCSGTIEVLRWSPNGKALAAGSSNGNVCVWQSLPASAASSVTALATRITSASTHHVPAGSPVSRFGIPDASPVPLSQSNRVWQRIVATVGSDINPILKPASLPHGFDSIQLITLSIADSANPATFRVEYSGHRKVLVFFVGWWISQPMCSSGCTQTQITIRGQSAQLRVDNGSPTTVSLRWAEQGTWERAMFPRSGVGYTIYAVGLTVTQVEQFVTSLQTANP